MFKNRNRKLLSLYSFLSKIRSRFSFHYVAYTTLIFIIAFSVVRLVSATTPNPGHPWIEVGDGVFTVTNNQTAVRAYTFPDANATILTTNDVVTVAQGGTGAGSLSTNAILYGNGTGAIQALAVNAGGTACLTQASSGAPAWGSCGSTLSDGDKGDVSVSGSGSVWTIDNGVITNTKINDVAWSKISGTPTTIAGYGITDAEAPLTFSGPLSRIGNTVLIPVATTSANGYLSSTDWNIFNGKQPLLSGTGFVKSTGGVISYDTNTYLTNAIISLNGLSGTTQTLTTGSAGTDFGISSVGTTHTFNIPTASAVNRGLLSTADWTTFNNKYDASNPSGFISDLSSFTTDDLAEGSNLYYTDDLAQQAVSVSGSPLTYDSGTGIFGIDQADSGTDGYLTSSDWNTFNNKYDASNPDGYISANENIILSGAITGSGTTSIVTTLEDGIVGLNNLSATGSQTSSTYLRGDNTWATLPSGNPGTVTSFAFTNGGGFTGIVSNATSTPTLSLTLQNAAADGSTKGQSTFTTSDFDASSGLISIDYTNGQAASGSTKGFLTSTDWTTFNNKGNGTVTSVSGTSNRITSTGGATPVIDIDAAYVGQTSLTTLGTITTGVWNGTAIANANLANSSITINGTSIALGASGTVTAAAGTLTGTTLNSSVVTSSLTSVGTIGTGTWQGTVIDATYGGTGINNGSNTITLAGNLVTTGAFNTTFAASATGTYTLPSATSTLLAHNLGISGGTTLIGDTASGGNLTLTSTSNATKGKIIFGSASAYDQVNDRFGISQTTPGAKLDILTTGIAATQADTSGILLENTTPATVGVPLQYSPTVVFDAQAYNSISTTSVRSRISLDNRPTTGANTRPIFTVSGSTAAGAYGEIMTVGQNNTGGNGYYMTIAAGRVIGNVGGITQVYTNAGGFNVVSAGLASVFTTISTAGITAFTPANSAATSGTVNSFSWAGTFAPTSGTGVFNATVITPTINQTGVTGTPITRGLYINPTLTAASDFRAIETASADYGNGAAGLVVMIGRNTNATNTGAGSINFLSKGGTNGYVWQDNAGNLRIHTAAPTNANDTNGTVIGAQTSTRDTKQDITDYTDYSGALAMVLDAPLHTFRYIKEVQGYGSNSPLAKTRIGYIADEVNAAFMVGNVIDQVSVNGILIASIKELNIKLMGFSSLDTSEAGSLGSLMTQFFADQAVLIRDLTVRSLHINEQICVDDVCATKEEFKALLLQAKGMGSHTSTNTTITTPEVIVETPVVTPDTTPSDTSPADLVTSVVIPEVVETPVSTPIVVSDPQPPAVVSESSIDSTTEQ